MNRLLHIGATGALLAFGAAAQDAEKLSKLKAEAESKQMMQMKMVGAIKGVTVKGAPYTAEEVNETNQALADGTRIHRETRTTVYRDSEGRTRRETPDTITITDPVANVTYILDSKGMTGQKLAMAAGSYTFYRSNTSSGAMGMPTTSTFTMTSSGEGPSRIILNGQPLDEKAVAEAMAKAQASGSTQTFTYTRRETTTSETNGTGTGMGIGTGAAGDIMSAMSAARTKMLLRKPGEPLGKQMVEGVNAEGTRNVSTIEIGAIGNDRPIQVTGESWYSDELQMVVMSKHSDPRTGDESFRLANIQRTEPAAYLFQLPTGYQITERK